MIQWDFIVIQWDFIVIQWDIHGIPGLVNIPKTDGKITILGKWPAWTLPHSPSCCSQHFDAFCAWAPHMAVLGELPVPAEIQSTHSILVTKKISPGVILLLTEGPSVGKCSRVSLQRERHTWGHRLELEKSTSPKNPGRRCQESEKNESASTTWLQAEKHQKKINQYNCCWM